MNDAGPVDLMSEEIERFDVTGMYCFSQTTESDSYITSLTTTKTAKEVEQVFAVVGACGTQERMCEKVHDA